MRLLRTLAWVLAVAMAPLPAGAIGDADGDAPMTLDRKLYVFPVSQRPRRVCTGYQEAGGAFVLHGVDVYYFDAPGRVKSMALQYRQGKKHGTFMTWYPNGKVKEHGLYEEGEKTGMWTYLAADGTKLQEVEYASGKKHGVLRQWDAGGTLRVEQRYEHDLKAGPETRYHADGKPQVAVNWKVVDGTSVLDGAAVDRYPNGKIRREATYRDGKLDGPYKEFYENGLPRRQVTYRQGVLHGAAVTWFPNGKTGVACTYVDGKLNGAYEEQDAEGNLLGRGEYRAGSIWSGKFREAGPTEDQYWVNVYEEGKVVDGVFFEAGKPKTGEVKESYPGGQLQRFYTLVNGKKNGNELWYYPTGQLEKQMSWKDNRLDGVYTEFFEDGRPRWIVNLKDGVRDGVETQWQLYGIGDDRDDYRVIARGEYRAGSPWEGTFLVTDAEGNQVLRKYEGGKEVELPVERLVNRQERKAGEPIRTWKVKEVYLETPAGQRLRPDEVDDMTPPAIAMPPGDPIPAQP